MMVCYAMAVTRTGMLGVGAREMKVLTEEGDSDTDW
jgi:hypothetical protein